MGSGVFATVCHVEESVIVFVLVVDSAHIDVLWNSM